MRSVSKQEEVIMGSSRVNCEITEAKDELSTIRKPQMFQQVRGEQRSPILKKGHNKFLNDNINKLFESVNIRMSKSLDLTDSLRNASKGPVRSPGSQSPGGGCSEPVSLKQALRGLCISQAAEMAAMKRLSMTSASPRISEAGKGASLYRSGVSPARGGERKTEIPRMMEASTSYSTGTSTQVLMRAHHYSFENFKSNIKSKDHTSSEPCHPKTVSENLSVISSPQNPVVLQIEDTEPSSIRNDAMGASEDDKQLAGIVCSREEKCTVISALPHCNSYDNVSKSDNKLFGLDKVISGPIKDSDTPLKVVRKAGHKVRRKSKLQPVPSSSVVKSNKDMKPTRSNSRTVIRNKNLIVKKSKKVAASTGGNLKTSYKINSGPEQLICQRCKCSLRDTNNDHSGAHPVTSRDQENRVARVTKTTKSTKKGDIISQSSSSICDLSSSTTSLSEECCVNGLASGNRPHMSKDVRWGAISRVRKQYGFLGLNYFNLLKKLGSGDIGTVYLAELIGTNCLFAIKVILMDNEFLATRKKMCRAKTEREILTMLDHPFLPTLYTQFTSNNMSCLVMEFCPGGDLHVLRQMQPGRYFPEQAARFYVAEVLVALEYLHMLGIVYRDLKPENILVREDGHIMLTDFDLSLRCSVNPTLVKSSSLQIEPPRISGPCAGSNCIDPFCSGPSCKVSCFSPRSFPSRKLKPDSAAQARSRLQLVCEPTEARSNSFVGTHEYLAPEIIKGEGHGSAVDWWTLGVLLYELLYGKTPFKGARNEQTLANVVLQSLRFPEYPMVSVQARDLIRGLLVKDPESRLGTETGAAEIKRHGFFEGLNWALIRSSVPPEIPEVYDVRDADMGSLDKGKGLVNYSGDGEHLELF